MGRGGKRGRGNGGWGMDNRRGGRSSWNGPGDTGGYEQKRFYWQDGNGGPPFNSPRFQRSGFYNGEYYSEGDWQAASYGSRQQWSSSASASLSDVGAGQQGDFNLCMAPVYPEPGYETTSSVKQQGWSNATNVGNCLQEDIDVLSHTFTDSDVPKSGDMQPVEMDHGNLNGMQEEYKEPTIDPPVVHFEAKNQVSIDRSRHNSTTSRHSTASHQSGINEGGHEELAIKSNNADGTGEDANLNEYVSGGTRSRLASACSTGKEYNEGDIEARDIDRRMYGEDFDERISQRTGSRRSSTCNIQTMESKDEVKNDSMGFDMPMVFANSHSDGHGHRIRTFSLGNTNNAQPIKAFRRYASDYRLAHIDSANEAHENHRSNEMLYARIVPQRRELNVVIPDTINFAVSNGLPVPICQCADETAKEFAKGKGNGDEITDQLHASIGNSCESVCSTGREEMSGTDLLNEAFIECGVDENTFTAMEAQYRARSTSSASLHTAGPKTCIEEAQGMLDTKAIVVTEDSVSRGHRNRTFSLRSSNEAVSDQSDVHTCRRYVSDYQLAAHDDLHTTINGNMRSEITSEAYIANQRDFKMETDPMQSLYTGNEETNQPIRSRNASVICDPTKPRYASAENVNVLLRSRSNSVTYYNNGIESAEQQLLTAVQKDGVDSVVATADAINSTHMESTTSLHTAAQPIDVCHKKYFSEYELMYRSAGDRVGAIAVDRVTSNVKSVDQVDTISAMMLTAADGTDFASVISGLPATNDKGVDDIKLLDKEKTTHSVESLTAEERGCARSRSASLASARSASKNSYVEDGYNISVEVPNVVVTEDGYSKAPRTRTLSLQSANGLISDQSIRTCHQYMSDRQVASDGRPLDGLDDKIANGGIFKAYPLNQRNEETTTDFKTAKGTVERTSVISRSRPVSVCSAPNEMNISDGDVVLSAADEIEFVSVKNGLPTYGAQLGKAASRTSSVATPNEESINERRISVGSNNNHSFVWNTTAKISDDGTQHISETSIQVPIGIIGDGDKAGHDKPDYSEVHHSQNLVELILPIDQSSRASMQSNNSARSDVNVSNITDSNNHLNDFPKYHPHSTTKVEVEAMTAASRTPSTKSDGSHNALKEYGTPLMMRGDTPVSALNKTSYSRIEYEHKKAIFATSPVQSPLCNEQSMQSSALSFGSPQSNAQKQAGFTTIDYPLRTSRPRRLKDSSKEVVIEMNNDRTGSRREQSVMHCCEDENPHKRASRMPRHDNSNNSGRVHVDTSGIHWSPSSHPPLPVYREQMRPSAPARHNIASGYAAYPSKWEDEEDQDRTLVHSYAVISDDRLTVRDRIPRGQTRRLASLFEDLTAEVANDAVTRCCRRSMRRHKSVPHQKSSKMMYEDSSVDDKRSVDDTVLDGCYTNGRQIRNDEVMIGRKLPNKNGNIHMIDQNRPKCTVPPRYLENKGSSNVRSLVNRFEQAPAEEHYMDAMMTDGAQIPQQDQGGKRSRTTEFESPRIQEPRNYLSPFDSLSTHISKKERRETYSDRRAEPRIGNRVMSTAMDEAHLRERSSRKPYGGAVNRPQDGFLSNSYAAVDGTKHEYIPVNVMNQATRRHGDGIREPHWYQEYAVARSDEVARDQMKSDDFTDDSKETNKVLRSDGDMFGAHTANTAVELAPPEQLLMGNADHKGTHSDNDCNLSFTTTTTIGEMNDSSDYSMQMKRLKEALRMQQSRTAEVLETFSVYKKNKVRKFVKIYIERELLLCRERQSALQRELQRIETLRFTHRRIPQLSHTLQGSCNVDSITVQLCQDFCAGNTDDKGPYAFIALLKTGVQVDATGAVSLIDTSVGSVRFGTQFCFTALPIDFAIAIEIYAMKLVEMRGDDGRLAMKAAYEGIGTNLSYGHPKNRLVNHSSLSSSEFTRCGFVVLKRNKVGTKHFSLEEAIYPLGDKIEINWRCSALPPILGINFNGFLNIMEKVSGKVSCVRCWAVLQCGNIYFWKDPDEQSCDKPPLTSIDLTKCVNEKITPATYKTNFPKVFAVDLIVESPSCIIDEKRVVLSADTEQLCMTWIKVINETLGILRA